MTNLLIENLKTLGLTDYEAKAYAALVPAGTAGVTEISQMCDVPRSNLYEVLESLCSKGFAEIQRGRPILFKAVAPSKAMGDIVKEKEKELEKAKAESLKELEKISGKKKESITPTLIWGIRGIDSVIGKINEITKRAKKEILINVPDFSSFEDELLPELKTAHARGVKIKIAVERKSKIGEIGKYAIVRTREKIHGIDIVADNREILIAPPLPVVAAWVDNEEMALHVKDFLQLVWKDADVMK
ncbi:MAG: helix-turn-helix domain-containing protein [Candidatus Micrarchaeota archaeon]